MRSLRARLLLLTLFVAGIALTSAAVLSRVAVRSEYLRLETREQSLRLSSVARLLAEEIAPSATPADIDAWLQRTGASIGHRLVILGPDGRVRGASSAELRGARFETNGDRLSIEMRETVQGVQHARRIVIVGAHRAMVRGPDGFEIGTLVALPAVASEEGPGEPRFVSSVNRWLLLAALGSGALALALTVALSRRILGPVEELTAAARRMEAGDRSQRVRAGSRDEIGDLGRAFNAMLDALERTETMRQRLVTDVAHELRTPLTNLRCQIEALQDGLQAPDQEALRSLHEETVLLSRLVSDLQDLALAESGQLPLRRGTVDVAEAVEAALSAIRFLANARGVTLHADVADDCTVDADRERLGQVLRNLLANALTHASPGDAVTVHARSADGGVKLEVSDTGPGIAPEHLPHVFDRFYRADASRTRATGGTGLGLAIVKRLVEAHGGTVAVASEQGHGARFVITLPSPV